MSMAYIRRTWGVPAKRGMRVIYTGSGVAMMGRITSSAGGALLVRLDGDARRSRRIRLHPTWHVEYVVLVEQLR